LSDLHLFPKYLQTTNSYTVTTAFLNSLPKTAGDIRGEMATVIKHSDACQQNTVKKMALWYVFSCDCSQGHMFLCFCLVCLEFSYVEVE
jgi:hypothetical protein